MLNMKIASFIADNNAKLDAFLNQRTGEIFIIAEDENGSIKLHFSSGRQLAYFIRFTSKLLASYMKKGRKNREEIIDAVTTNAEAGADEILENVKQATLEVITSQ